MRKKTIKKRLAKALFVSLSMALLSVKPEVYAQKLPDLGDDQMKWDTFLTYENYTSRREARGLDNFRNTLQFEAKTKTASGWNLFTRLRGSWNGVYRLNSDEFGKDAGGPIMSESLVNGQQIPVPWGSSQGPVVTHDMMVGMGLTNNQFLNNGGSPNVGLRPLGDSWHGIDGHLSLAVPVRPCDKDHRGCTDFGGYGDQSLRSLEFPEFNDRLDFLREIYADKVFELGGGQFGGGVDLFVRVGRQQIVWGRTDLFRVLDVLNPVDYSRNNIYDELSDIRYPMWMAQAEFRFGGGEIFQEKSLQLVWNFDKPRADNLGQCGQPSVMLDAGCLFRALKTIWDYGGTVANFANVGPNTYLATNFGPGQLGIRNVDLREWKLSNTQLGAKFEGVLTNGITFSLNGAYLISQLPSLHGAKSATNAFNNEHRDYWPYMISFDMVYPRVKLIGGSMDMSIGPGVMRLEVAHTWGEEFANTLRPELYSKNRVLRSVLGWDMPIDLPHMTNSMISTQLFYQHIFGYERRVVNDSFNFGPAGMVDWEDNVLFTFLIRGSMMNDMFAPQMIYARDFRAQANVISPQLEWKYSPRAKLTFGANYKWLDSGAKDRWSVDDCRSCNPWPPFTAPYGDPNPMEIYSRGLASLEPLGRFRAGPIGTAFNEDEIYVKFNYQF